MQKIKPILIVMLILSTLGIMQLAHAEELYRWREADGTLTFSPTPPPAGSGIAFEKINSVAGAARANPEPAQVSNQGLTPGVSQGLNQESALIPATNSALMAQQPTRITASSKNGHCNDLRKRVQSLERLIMTDVSNETMDNAVVQMARYQNSFNQSCKGVTH